MKAKSPSSGNIYCQSGTLSYTDSLQINPASNLFVQGGTLSLDGPIQLNQASLTLLFGTLIQNVPLVFENGSIQVA